MKNLKNDDEGLIPLIVGIAIASVLGYTWLTDTSEDSWEFVKVLVVASLIFTFGLLALMGKFTLPKAFGVMIGIGCIAGSIYLVYLGSFPW